MEKIKKTREKIKKMKNIYKNRKIFLLLINKF